MIDRRVSRHHRVPLAAAVHRDDFVEFMFAQSEPWPDSIAVVRALRGSAAPRD